MRWYSASFAALALLGSSMSAYGENHNLQTGTRSVLRAPLRQASVRRSSESAPATVVAPSQPHNSSPAQLTGAGPIGSGAGGARRIFAGTVRNNVGNLGEGAASESYDSGPVYDSPPNAGFVGGCCEDSKPCCNHLWDGFCDEKNCDCPKCSQKRGSCKQNCCRRPKCYRQDLFTWLKNQRAMKQAECGCESGCDTCGETSCGCGETANVGSSAGMDDHSGHVHANESPAYGEPMLDRSPSDQLDTPIETAPEAGPGAAPEPAASPEEAAPEVPAPAGEGQLEAPGNERAARRFGTPRHAYTPVRFRGN